MNRDGTEHQRWVGGSKGDRRGEKGQDKTAEVMSKGEKRGEQGRDRTAKRVG